MTANHDRINLGRLVKRLEKSVEGEDWSQDGGHNTWIKTQGTLQVWRAVILVQRLTLIDIMA